MIGAPEDGRDASLRNVTLAATCGADAATLVFVALETMGPATMEEALRLVAERGPEWARACRDAPPPTALATLEPELRFAPELARVRPEEGDHELRGHLLFRELVGRRSFFQVAALSIAGLELSSSDAELLEHLGVNTQLADARIWPLTLARRIAARGGPVRRAVAAAMATMLNPRMAVEPVGGFVRVLDDLEAGERDGHPVERQLDDLLDRGVRLPGVGRPALGPDERNAGALELARRFGRADGPSVRLALAVDEHVERRKRQRINSAGLQAAIMRDMGFTATTAPLFCTLYFLVPIVSQAAFAHEAARTRG